MVFWHLSQCFTGQLGFTYRHAGSPYLGPPMVGNPSTTVVLSNGALQLEMYFCAVK